MMLTAEEKNSIAVEMERARAAISAGNDGKARVCSRRAAGIALQAYYRTTSGAKWSGDAQTLLINASTDAGFPAEVREASVRLTTSVTKKDSAPFSTDPIADALTIISKLETGGS